MPTELFKDKVEVSLDGRQIFYLFFGGAVIVGMVFVLGVMVGRRVEARGHVDHAQTTAASDPLAALDRLEGSNGLSFHGTLLGNEAPPPVEKTIAEVAAKPIEKPIEKPVEKQIDKPIEKPADAEDKPAKKKPKDADAATFTLQVSSFQDKSEAEALLSSIRSTGYQAYLTSAEVEGKGTFYRVRVGKYASLDAANDAKSDFEKTAKRSALVTRL